MNSDNNSTIYCVKCGAEMKADSRCCMKCGTLNPDHPDNANMLKYMDQKQTSYQVGSGTILSTENTSSKDITTVVGRNTGSFNICFTVNLLLYLLIIIPFCLFSASSFDWDIAMISTSYIPIVVIYVSVGFLWIFANELLFMKMNQKWWYSLIPVYNNMILAKCLFNNMWLGLIVLIPFIGQVFFLVLLYKLAVSFKKNGILMILFPLLMVVIIGYGSSSFNNKNFVSEGDNALEKEFKKKKIFLSLCVFLILICGGAYTYFNFDIINENKNKTILYIESKYVMYKLKGDTGKIKEKCNSGSIVFHRSSEASDSFLGKFDVYVRMIKNGDNDYYYISMTDGKYGHSEILESELTIEKIFEYNKLEIDLQNSDICNYE